jgi:hypothetical protein
MKEGRAVKLGSWWVVGSGCAGGVVEQVEIEASAAEIQTGVQH